MGRLTTLVRGESPWDAIVNHKGLDFAEELGLEVYCVRLGYDWPKLLPLETLEELYRQWQKVVGRHFGAPR